MSYVKRREDRGLDWILLSLFITMLGVGWLMVYTVGYGDGYPESIFEVLSTTIVGRQTVWIGMAILVLFLTQIIGWKFWRTFSWPIYGLGIVLLILVLFLGSTIKGATSWFAFGGFSFQPAEIAKFGTAIALASYLNDFNTNLKRTNSQLTAFAILAAPILLILMQPDAGSALVFLSFFILLYRAGLNVNYYAVGGYLVILLLIGLVFPTMPILIILTFLAIYALALTFKYYKLYFAIGVSILAIIAGWYSQSPEMWPWVLLGTLAVFAGLAFYHWGKRKDKLVFLLIIGLGIGGILTFSANYAFNNFLASHQRDRINVWLRPSLCDPRGSLYNLVQSKMAIGSGGLMGKGFLEGNMTKLNYVPEQSTDFIFCTIGEEQGFLGTIAIIGLYLLLLIRITTIAERQRSEFSKYYAYGVAGIIFIHVFINIGMTIGLMPVVGIPLPFISYGGSSLLGFTLLIGVLMKLDAHREEP
jgi:rod shape determining protein RodA